MEVIEIGGKLLNMAQNLPENVHWTVRDGRKALFDEDEKRPRSFDVVILDGAVDDANIPEIRKLGASYTYFYTDELEMSEPVKELLGEKMAVRLDPAGLRNFLGTMPQKYFNGQHGSKLSIREISVYPRFGSCAAADGYRAMVITSDFGEEYVPVLTWRYNIFVMKGKNVELWLEHKETDGAEIELRVNLYRRGGLDVLESSRVYAGEELKEPILIEDRGFGGYISVTLLARGSGAVDVGPLHFRESRLGAGQFLPGGRRHAFAGGQEFISYFNPGDRKPPLNVYFSGYRTAEGFEGYFIMNAMQSPFLLIGDPRLEGGAFYLGDKEFEDGLAGVIRDALEELGFTKDQLILSGMSMGTFGAVYYGSVLEPHAIIIGKPLMNLGNVAANEKRLRPGGFPTSLDVLRSNTGGNTAEHAAALNKRLWERFDKADFSHTEFAISYMYQDDYDKDGFPDILEHLRQQKVTVVSKGLEGRHNDNTSGVVNWFMSQYRRIIETDFGREVSST